MITLEAATLAGALKHAASVVESRNTIPILANALLCTRDGELEIVTTDLDCEFRQTVPLAQSGELAITVSAQRLAAIAGAADKGAQITLEMEGSQLSVKTGRSRFRLPTLPRDDFPTIPVPEFTASVEIPGKALAAALARVAPSISTETIRYYLNGTLLNAEGDKLRFASTDGHRLCAADTDVDWPEGAPEIIMPTKAVRELQKLFEGAKAVTLSWDDRKLRAEAGGITFTSKVIDGTFPDYRRVIPPAVDDPIRFDPEQARAALRRIQLVASGKTRAVKLEAQADCLVLSATDPDGGTACEELPAQCAGGHQTGFNAAYLAQMLETIGGDTVELHHADPGAPCLVRRTTGGDAIGVVMPLRV